MPGVLSYLSPQIDAANYLNLNYLINGGHEVNQRSTTGSFSGGLGCVLHTDAYSDDRWKCASTAADIQFQRTDTNGALETGLNSRYYGTWKNVTNSGNKNAIYQVIEAVNGFPLAGRMVTVQCKLKYTTLTNSNKKFKLCLIQLNSSGTVDTMPAHGLVETWNGDGVDDTLATNLAYINPSSIPAGAQGVISVSGAAIACTLTTSWQLFAGTFIVPSSLNAKNLIVAIMADAGETISDTFSMSEAGLYDGAVLRDYLPRPYVLELALCQRYCYGMSADGSTSPIFACAGTFVSATNAIVFVPFPVTMRIAPNSVTLVSAVAKFQAYDGGTTYLCSALVIQGNTQTTKGTNLSSTNVAGTANRPAMLLGVDNTAQLYFNADF